MTNKIDATQTAVVPRVWVYINRPTPRPRVGGCRCQVEHPGRWGGRRVRGRHLSGGVAESAIYFRFAPSVVSREVVPDYPVVVLAQRGISC